MKCFAKQCINLSTKLITNGYKFFFPDMVKIHVAVIAILSTLYISTQARNVGQYAEEPMDRMVKTNSFLKEAKSLSKFLFCLR